MIRLADTDAWKALERHRDEVAGLTMREMFAADPERFQRLSIDVDGLFLDYSKNRLTTETLDKLIALAETARLAEWRDSLFAGQPINASEGRAAQHVALRDDGSLTGDFGAEIAAANLRLREFTETVRSGDYRGASSEPIRHVVNIGIGGSYMGPLLATTALAEDLGAASGAAPDVRFVANLDGHDMATTLRDLNPETTLFLIASKSFSTEETMLNAASARAWLIEGIGGDDVSRHFVGLTANRAAALEFGIAAENIFEFWDWVGGRFSLWSSVGLSVSLAAGNDKFRALLAGAHAMDRHFATAPLAANMPVLLGLIGVWNINFLGIETMAVLPYDQRLRHLPEHLQQLEMESNGKRVTRDGRPVDGPTAPVIFGAAGTVGQHSFHQHLHQGSSPVATDFIGVAEPGHDRLISHMLAQAAALMRGRNEDEVRADLAATAAGTGASEALAPHMTCPGNRPSNTLLLRRLTPETLGMLLALYEHKIFVEGVLWGINSFDQFGVEFGKTLAAGLLGRLTGDGSEDGDADSSTTGLIDRYRRWRDSNG